MYYFLDLYTFFVYLQLLFAQYTSWVHVWKQLLTLWFGINVSQLKLRITEGEFRSNWLSNKCISFVRRWQFHKFFKFHLWHNWMIILHSYVTVIVIYIISGLLNVRSVCMWICLRVASLSWWGSFESTTYKSVETYLLFIISKYTDQDKIEWLTIFHY